MRIAEFSVKNPQFTLIVFLMVMAMGVNALLNMPRSEDPEFQAPIFVVTVVYPGAGPADMEELVADPIEEKLNELENLKEVVTTIDDGLVVIRVEYEYSQNPDDKYQEVVREVNSIRGSLPADLFKLEINKISPSDVNIFQVALMSETAPYTELQAEAERLKESLERIRSLKKVALWGFPERELRITLDPARMAQWRISTDQLIRAIQSDNQNIPGGSISIGQRQFNVKTSGDYRSVEEIGSTVVATNGRQITRLRDIASIDLTYEETRHLTRLNGRRAVFVTASQKPGMNIFKTGNEAETAMAQFRAQLPSHIGFEQSFDQARSVRRRLTGFAKDFGIAILLVSLTLLPLGLRAALVVMVSIPLSISIGLALLDWLGYSMNQLSIVGLIIALGLLVDDSIVVVENIERHLRMGYTRRDAAIVATKQIGLAVLGCTATLIFAFLPLLFLPGASGDFIRSLPMAVVMTVAASLFVSLTIIPFLSSRMLSDHEQPEGNLFMRLLKRIISGSYARLLEASLRRPWTALLVTLLIFGGVMTLIPKVGFSLFPKSEKPQFLVNIETPLGASLLETDRVTREVEQVLDSLPVLRNYASNVGKGNPRIYYNVIQQNESPNFAQIFVQLTDISPEEKEAHINQLRKRFSFFPNARIEVKDFEQGPPIEAPIAIRIFGENLDSLRSVAYRVESLIRQTPGSLYVNNPLSTLRSDLRVVLNKEKAGMLGIPEAEVDRSVRMGIAGLNIGSYTNVEGKEFPLVLSLPKGAKQGYDVFNKLYVNSVTGASVPLSQVAELQFESSVPFIRHKDKARYVTVSSYVQPGYLTGELNAQIEEKLRGIDLPDGFHFEVAGEQESKSESFEGIGTIVILTIFGLLAVLILEFSTFKGALIVLSVIPLGIIGAVLALLATGNTFAFVSITGLIALAGIEVKNSILLVDFTNQLRAQGMALDQAIREAGETRFVPIVLTSLTAIGGLTPLAIEANPLYSPLAWVLIGGLITSTLLSRIVTPVLYKLLPPSLPEA